MGFLLWLAFEILGPVVVEVGLSIVLIPSRALDKDPRARLAAALWFAFLGAILGGVSCLVFPERLSAPGPFPGASLLFLPLAGAGAMQSWGWLRGVADQGTSHFSTWYGGGAFGLGYAAARLGGLAVASQGASL